MATNPLKFYKGWYGTGEGRHLPELESAIIFNEQEGILYVNGKSYSGATDVEFNNGVLKFKFNDGREPIILDFNDTASASATYQVFERIDALIGPNISSSDGDGTLEYGDTNYLSNVTTLVDADIKLDEEIKNVNDRIDDLDVNGVKTVTVSEENGAAKLTFNGVKQVDGEIDEDSDYDELQFAKVATTGAAEDVAYTNTSYGLTATNVQDAIDEVVSDLNDAIDALDGNATIASVSDGVVTLKTNVVETNGIIDDGDSDIELSKVATTGAAEDVSYNDTNSAMGTEQNPVNTVQKAIESLDSRLDDIQSIDVFDTVVSTDAASTPSGASWTSGGQTITGNLPASADTMHKIYLVPDTNETAQHTGTYNEYISVRTGTNPNYSYNWELIGSTKADLTGYVKTIIVNGKEYAVANNTTQITLTDVITSITGESTTDLNNTSLVNVKATTSKDTQLGTNVTTLVSSVKVSDVEDADSDTDGLATAYGVKTYINSVIGGLDSEVYSAQSESDFGEEPIVVGINQIDGKIDNVEVFTLGAEVSYDGSDDVFEVTNQKGMALGSDIMLLKEYVDYKSSIATTTVSNGDDTLVVNKTTNADGSNDYDVRLTWTEFTGQPESPENNG